MSCTIDDLIKVGLRIGTILSVEPVEGSEKLLKLMVDLAEEQPRQILSGVAKYYTTEELMGKQVVVVTELEPRMMMGLESQGMILMANSEERPQLLSPISSVESGATIQ